MELYKLTIHELKEKLKKQEISAKELTLDFFKRIERVDKDVHSFITITKNDALKQAEEAEKRIINGDNLPLLGIPLAIKDLICIKGVRNTCGSKMLSNYIPPYDATVIKKLRESGAVFLGKLNMDEFAMGSSTETSHFGVTRNPWDLKTIPGGSSGGSAAAVAADECAGSLGSDTGGSIRQPAAMCGVVGLKPTYGRVSRFGLVAFASSLDQIGPITKDVTDTAILMNIISGRDPLDSTSADIPVPDFTRSLRNDVKGLKIGIPKEYFVEGMDVEVEKSVKDAIELFKRFGAEIKDVSLPHADYAISTYYVIAPAEASSNLARYDGVKYGYRTNNRENLLGMYKKTRQDGFGTEVKRRIMLGTYALSSGYYDAYYLKAQKIRTLLKRGFESAFKKFNVLIAPSMPILPFKLGEKINDPLSLYMSDIDTVPANLTGIPAISIPGGLYNGLPIGVQIMAPPFREDILFKIGFMIESSVKIDLTIGEFTHV